MVGNMANTGQHGHQARFEPRHSALLIIDMLNDLEFEGGEELREQAMPVATAIAHLRDWYHAHGLPVIYANDNFGRWRSDFTEVAGGLDCGARTGGGACAACRSGTTGCPGLAAFLEKSGM